MRPSTFSSAVQPMTEQPTTGTSSLSPSVGDKRPAGAVDGGLVAQPTTLIVGPKRYILAVDLERTGPSFRYGVWAIGACFGTDDGTILETVIGSKAAMDERDYDPKTWDEFWSKLPDIRNRINSFAVDNHMRLFHQWLEALETRYGPFGRKHTSKVKLSLASDNPGYDFGHLMVEFRKHGYEHGVAEMFDDYVSTDDPSEQENGLMPDERKEAVKMITAGHTHDPLDDAIVIFQHLCGIRRVLKMRAVQPPSSDPPTTPTVAPTPVTVRPPSDSDYE